MTTPRLDHIGIAVADLDAAIQMYRKLGFETGPVEELAPQGVRLSFCPLTPSATEGGRIELLAALGPETAIGRFLAAKGPGIHHLCFSVEDIRAEMTRLAGEGFALIDKEPRQGAHGALVAFLHPKSTAGVLIELSQIKG